MAFKYRCAIVDDRLRKDDEGTFKFKHEIYPTIFPSISSALTSFGITDTHLATKGDGVLLDRLSHNFDIVLLDFELLADEMRAHPMGGVSLAPLYIETFDGRKNGLGNCVCQPYSDKMWKAVPAAAALYQITMTASLKTPITVYPNAFEYIDIDELLRLRTYSLGQSLPSVCIHEISDLLLVDERDEDAFFNTPLPRLARYMRVDEITLKELLPHLSQEAARKWILSNLGSKSFAQSQCSAYITCEIDKAAHSNDALTPDEFKKFFVDTSDGYAVVSGGKVHPVCEELFGNAVALNWQTNEERSRLVKSCFRMHLGGDLNQGYSPTELDNLLNNGYKLYWHIAKGYLFVQANIIGRLVINAAEQLREPVKEENKVVCHIIGLNRLIQPELLFVLPQQSQIDYAVATTVASVIDRKPRWGLFPEILNWGSVYLKSTDSIFLVCPGFQSQLGANSPEIRDIYYALTDKGIDNAILFGIPWNPPI